MSLFNFKNKILKQLSRIEKIGFNSILHKVTATF